jgi:hypothetical protein
MRPTALRQDGVPIPVLAGADLPPAKLLAAAKPSTPRVEQVPCFPQVAVDDQLDSRATAFASVKSDLDVDGRKERRPTFANIRYVEAQGVTMDHAVSASLSKKVHDVPDSPTFWKPSDS